MNSPATSSGLLTADTAVLSAPGRLLSVQLIADGTNAATLIIYDNTSAAGTVLAKLSLAATGTYQDAHLPAEGFACNKGIYADVTGTGAAFIIGFSQG